MSLKYIKIDGFRNIKKTKIDFNQITSILSINSYGKSNLLTAFDFGTIFITSSSQKKNKMMRYIHGIPMTLTNLYHDFEFELGLDLEISKQKFEIIYGYSFKWENLKSEGLINKEYLKIRESQESHKFSLYIDRNQKKAFYKTSLTGRCDKEINIENDELVINKIKAFDNLFYLEIIKYLNSISIYIDRHLDASESFNPSPLIFKGSNEFDLNKFSDIARILYRLKKEHKNKYELIINTVMDIFPFITNIEVKEHILESKKIIPKIMDDSPFEFVDKIYTLYAEHKNMEKKLSFNSLSDGVRRILLLYTFTVLAQLKNTLLIAIEEPENSINPGLFKKYLIGLRNFIDYSKIIITSHSPFLINYVNPSDLYIGVPNSSYDAIFKKIKKNNVSKLIDQARENEMMAGEYIFDLMNGNEYDFEELCRYLEND